MSVYLIIRGPLGCGKTTIAKRLSESLGAECFAVDRVLEQHGLDRDWEDGYISQKSFIKANKIIVDKAKDVLDSGKPVIFDGNFYWKSQIEDLIARLDCSHYVFTLKAPLDVCIERDKNRQKTHGKDAAIAVFKKSTEFDYGIVIDIDKPVEECIKEILEHIK